MAYPADINSLVDKSTTQTVTANDHNSQNDALREVRDVLGTQPQGGESTVQDRLSIIEGNLGSNILINGNFDIDQENVGSVTSVANNGYMNDMYQYNFVGAGIVDYNQSSSVPTANDYSQNSLEIDVTTADASIAATDYYVVTTYVEGYDYFSLHNSQDITLSFWVYGTVTGTHCVSFQNSAQNRSYVAEYSIGTTNTWEYKTVTLMSDSSGTWLFDENVGLRINWALAAGSNFQGTVDTWNGANDLATSNQVNQMSSNTNFFRLAQVKLERGSTATDFGQSIRLFEQELALCQRYYQKSYNLAVAPGTATAIGRRHTLSDSSGNIRESTEYATHMRADANITIYATTTGASGFVDDGASTYAIGGTVGAQSSYFVSVSSMSANSNSRWQWVADARY